MKYLIEPSKTPVTIGSNSINDVGKTQRAVKSALTRAGIDWVNAVQHTRFCAWCGKPNSKILLKLCFDGITIRLGSDGYYKELNCCFSGGCEYTKLNPNSVEFISKSRGLSPTQALEFAHSRNLSPFYQKNHRSDEDYSRYQGTRCFDGIKNSQEIIAKQNAARSLDGYISRFGEVEGPTKWNQVQKRKAITLENLTLKHGAKAAEKLQLWKNSVSCSLENFIRRHGKENGKRLFAQTVGTHGFYSPITFTELGSALRSNLERTFFGILSNHRLVEGKDFYIDGQYPNSAQRYDFWFPAIDLFVEVAGSSTMEYRDKMKQKHRDFGAMIVTPHHLIKVATEIAQCLSQ